uniref:Uncharacterized protein n=1 Tax=Knipowitschia caucasica TaxID=637954 RepID=A0AAV2JQF1_KNICA
MYLKAACSEIPVPRQRGGPRLERCSSVQQTQRQGSVSKTQPSSPTTCVPPSFDVGRTRERQSFEELLRAHRHFFQGADLSAGMVYRREPSSVYFAHLKVRGEESNILDCFKAINQLISCGVTE